MLSSGLWQGGGQGEGNCPILNFKLWIHFLRPIFEKVVSQMQNMGLKIIILGKFEGKIEILTARIFTVENVHPHLCL